MTQHIQLKQIRGRRTLWLLALSQWWGRQMYFVEKHRSNSPWWDDSWKSPVFWKRSIWSPLGKHNICFKQDSWKRKLEAVQCFSIIRSELGGGEKLANFVPNCDIFLLDTESFWNLFQTCITVFRPTVFLQCSTALLLPVTAMTIDLLISPSMPVQCVCQAR